MKKLSKKTKITLLALGAGLVTAVVAATAVACSQPYNAPFTGGSSGGLTIISPTTGQSVTFPDHTDASYTLNAPGVYKGTRVENPTGITASDQFSAAAQVWWTNSNYQGNNWKKWSWVGGNLGPDNCIPPLNYFYYQWFYSTTYNQSINGGGTAVSTFSNINAGATQAQNISILKAVINLLGSHPAVAPAWPITGALSQSNPTLNTHQVQVLSSYLQTYLLQQIQGATAPTATGKLSEQTILNQVLNNVQTYKQSLADHGELTARQKANVLSTLQISPAGTYNGKSDTYTFSLTIGTGSNAANSQNINKISGQQTISIPANFFTSTQIGQVSKNSLVAVLDGLNEAGLKLNGQSLNFIAQPQAGANATYTLTSWQQNLLNQALQDSLPTILGKQNLGQIPPTQFTIAPQLASFHPKTGVATANLNYWNGGSSPVTVGTITISGFPTNTASTQEAQALLSTIVSQVKGTDVNWPQLAFQPASSDSASQMAVANDALLSYISNTVNTKPGSALFNALKGYNLASLAINPTPGTYKLDGQSYPDFNGGENFGAPINRANQADQLPLGAADLDLTLAGATSSQPMVVGGFQYSILPGVGYFAQVLNPLNQGNNTNNPKNLQMGSSNQPGNNITFQLNGQMGETTAMSQAIQTANKSLPVQNQFVFQSNQQTMGSGGSAQTVYNNLIYQNLPNGNVISAQYSTNTTTPERGSNGQSFQTYQGTVVTNWHVNPQFLSYITRSLQNATTIRIYCNFYTILAKPGQSLYNTAQQNGNIAAFSDPTIPSQVQSISNGVASNDGFVVSPLTEVHIYGNYNSLVQQGVQIGEQSQGTNVVVPLGNSRKN